MHALMTGRRYVVMDRDGTLIVSKPYLRDPDDVALLPGTVPGLREMRRMGLGLIVVTNQSAIGRGMLDWGGLARIHHKLAELLERGGVSLDGIYSCPHTPEQDCDCRKPRSGLLRVASKDLGFQPQSCFVIGDNRCDIELGRGVSATTILVRTGYGAQIQEDPTVGFDYVADDLLDAARTIERALLTHA